MTDILRLAAQNQQTAYDIIAQSKIIDCWQAVGAEINLIGSLKTGLLMKHRDIDFHIYTPTLDIARSFKAVSALAQNPHIKKVTYDNLLNLPDTCLEWHAWYETDDGSLWQIDMIHMPKGSPFDGYFEKIAERISAVMSPAQKETILRLKYQTPDNQKIPGIMYYMAVLRDNITEYAAFENWLQQNKTDGIINWIP